jgi:regulator of protease activity HflC (stomatin/prohibitin superfamily)
MEISPLLIIVGVLIILGLLFLFQAIKIVPEYQRSS